jgi:hypothetical protein
VANKTNFRYKKGKINSLEPLLEEKPDGNWQRGSREECNGAEDEIVHHFLRD